MLAVLSLLLLPVAYAAAPRSYSVAALTADNQLVLFNTATPQTTRVVKLSGINETVLGIDVRPLDGKLYGITTRDQLVTLTPATGVMQRVARLGSPFGGGAASGFDFNPQADRLRLVGPTGQNLRVQVLVGAVAVDGVLSYKAGDRGADKRPSITAVAYTNAYANAPSTVMFDIDAQADTLLRQDPPNDGVLQTVGPLGVDCGEAAAFDIASPQPGVDDAFAICGTTLYRINLQTGAAQAVGAIGGVTTGFSGMALLPASGR
jgi:hypothetical protein